MARSRAQSECEEVSTGTKTSLYGMTPPSAAKGSLNGVSDVLGSSVFHHQIWRCANTAALQQASSLVRFARATRPTGQVRRARYGQRGNVCQGPPLDVRIAPCVGSHF